MIQQFLHKTIDNRKLILVFGGWGCDSSVYEGIAVNGWDLLLCYGYDDFNFDKNLLEQYRTIYLYAWSLGVFAAERSLKGVKFARATAINGTTTPVDDDYGIPQNIYSGTADSLTKNNLLKFGRRMFSTTDLFNRFRPMFERQNISVLQHQLRVIAEECKKPHEDRLNWTEVIIGRNDRIFPIENMSRAWQECCCITETDDAHFIDIAELVNSTVINSSRVGKLFARSAETYDANAIIQKKIAENLANKLVQYVHHNAKDILEIGYGSGLFSKEYASRLCPDSITYVDLCSALQKLKLAHTEKYIQADAEQWIASLSIKRKFDAIVSASTIQWFADQHQFLNDCALHMKTDGIIAISTFGSRNMEQLNCIRKSPIRYLSIEILQEWILQNFEILYADEQIEMIEFYSILDMLRHLKLTGVTGGTKASPIQIRKITEIFKPNKEGKYQLTYNPIYLIGKKK